METIIADALSRDRNRCTALMRDSLKRHFAA